MPDPVGERRLAIMFTDVEGRVNTIGSWNLAFAAVEALAVAGRREEAAALGPLVLDALENRGEWITFDCRLTRTRAGIAAAAAGRLDEAEDHYRAALGRAEELGMRIEAADLRRMIADVLLERGDDGDHARELLDGATAAYAEMGMPGFESLARAQSRNDAITGA